MKFISYISAFIIILSFFIGDGAALSDNDRYELPKWVPQGAIQAALKKLPVIEYTAKRIAPLYSKRKNVTSEEVALEYKGVELKYPYEIVYVKRQGYSEGDNLLDYFYHPSIKEAPNLQEVGFGVYLDTLYVGFIEVKMRPDSTWSWMGHSARSVTNIGEGIDPYTEVNRRYPGSEGYKVYKRIHGFIYFIEKEGWIETVFKYGYRCGCWLTLTPDEYMTSE